MVLSNLSLFSFGSVEARLRTHFSSISVTTLLFFAIIIGAFEARIVDLNYNTAFNDEAIYVVIGRMGLFASDWWSYGAKLWMAGLPYIYPTLTALVYETGGLTASRFLNVIFGVMLVEEVYRFARLINVFDVETNKRAALVSAFLVAFSGVGIFVSKLATYDMPSFLLFMIGVNSFIKAQKFKNGKYYFLTFVSLFSAFLTKIIIAVFFPLLFVIGAVMLKDRSKRHLRLAFLYLVIPFLISMALYALFYRENLAAYVNTHRSLGLAEDSASIPMLIWNETKVLLVCSTISSLVFLKERKFKLIGGLFLLAATVPFFHLSLNRYATLDKHLYLTIIFLSVIVGYGASYLFKIKQLYWRFAFGLVMSAVAIYYMVNGRDVLYELGHSWGNTTALQDYLVRNIEPGDKILAEEGGVVILALYNEIFPPKNIVTFDWIDYAGMTTDKGYLQAVNDSYFDYIELDDNFAEGNSLKEEIYGTINTNYYLAYKNDSYNVYKKYE